MESSNRQFVLQFVAGALVVLFLYYTMVYVMWKRTLRGTAEFNQAFHSQPAPKPVVERTATQH